MRKPTERDHDTAASVRLFRDDLRLRLPSDVWGDIAQLIADEREGCAMSIEAKFQCPWCMKFTAGMRAPIRARGAAK